MIFRDLVGDVGKLRLLYNADECQFVLDTIDVPNKGWRVCSFTVQDKELITLVRQCVNGGSFTRNEPRLQLCPRIAELLEAYAPHVAPVIVSFLKGNPRCETSG